MPSAVRWAGFPCGAVRGGPHGRHPTTGAPPHPPRAPLVRPSVGRTAPSTHRPCGRYGLQLQSDIWGARWIEPPVANGWSQKREQERHEDLGTLHRAIERRRSPGVSRGAPPSRRIDMTHTCRVRLVQTALIALVILSGSDGVHAIGGRAFGQLSQSVSHGGESADVARGASARVRHGD